ALGNTTGSDADPQVTAVGSEGAYVVTWSGEDSDGDDSIFVQRFNANGTLNGNTVQLEALGNTTGSDIFPQITAVGSEGAYVVTWSGEDSDDDSIFVQLFNANGTPNGNTVQLEAPGNAGGSDKDSQVIAVGNGGAYVVTWYGRDSDNDDSIFVQRFNADGTPNGDTVQLEALGNTTGSDRFPQITAVGSDGAFVVTWQGANDVSGDSIFVQLFNADGTVATNNIINDSKSVTVQSSEVGMAYLVLATEAGNINSLSDIEALADNQYNRVEITSANSNTVLEATGLVDGTYVVYTADAAGNLSAKSDNTITVDSTVSAVTFVLAGDTGTSNTDGITSDATVNVTLADDVASWQYSIDGGVNWTAGRGSSFELAVDSTYSVGQIQVRQTDAAGNTSDVRSNDSAITVDTTASAPPFALANDTGISDSDGITNDATINVTLAEDAVSWEYSIDGGENWTTGTGSSFELGANATYDAEQIQVRQTDKAGNTSNVSSNENSITVDTTALLAPSFALASDTGSSASDDITNDATINVTLAEDAASWEYSIDGGLSWTTGSGSSFELGANASYAEGRIQIRQTDTAGNTSAASSNVSAITTDTTISAVAFALVSDSGISNDGITNDATVNVILAEDVASWEYSVDKGASWTRGTGDSFELGANATYAIGDIQVRQTDAAGNTSDIRSNDRAITVDTTAPAVAAENAVTWSEDGKSVTLKFSEAVDVSTLTIDKFTLAAGKSFGDGATVSASDDDNDGFADTFTISLGTGEDATAASGDTVAIDKSNVIDVAGNTAGEDVTMVDEVSPTIVVFNLTTGKSSSVDGGRVFEESVSYTIYIVVDSDDDDVSLDDGYSWAGGANLGVDDEIVLVGNDANVAVMQSGRSVQKTIDHSGVIYFSNSRSEHAAYIAKSGTLKRFTTTSSGFSVDLWVGAWKSNPNGDEGNFADRYKNALPSSVSQAVTWATPS
ncbi:hypothetical protein UA24_19205, partial [Marinomonas sp. BSi20414]